MTIFDLPFSIFGLTLTLVDVSHAFCLVLFARQIIVPAVFLRFSAKARPNRPKVLAGSPTRWRDL